MRHRHVFFIAESNTFLSVENARRSVKWRFRLGTEFMADESTTSHNRKGKGAKGYKIHFLVCLFYYFDQLGLHLKS